MPDLTLVNMKQEPTPEPEATVAAPERPAYPWGLSVNLENDALEKLGLKTLPDVGEQLMLVARVEVTSVSEHESQGSEGAQRSVGLQITDMALGPNEDTTKPETQDVLYGSRA